MNNAPKSVAAEPLSVNTDDFPIQGMTKHPNGLPLMTGAWLGLIYFAASEAEMRAAFTEDTGHDLLRVLRAGGLDKLVDKATGYDRAVVAAFADWVTVNMWGEEGADDDYCAECEILGEAACSEHGGKPKSEGRTE
jgi:hypothetical protein